MPNAVVYAATKSAMDSVTRILAKELGGRKIRVNAIAPGGVETEGTHSRGHHRQRLREADGGRRRRWAASASRTISRRVAVFLASDDSAWVTGERITASGGF